MSTGQSVADMEFPTLLNEYCFVLQSKDSQLYKVSLDDTELKIIGEKDGLKKAKTIQYTDIIGVILHTREEPPATQAKEAGSSDVTFHELLNIYSMPSSKALFSSKHTKKKICCSLELAKDQNTARAQGLLQYIRDQLLLKADCNSFSGRFSKPVLVIVNPVSGPGTAKKLFKDKVSPVFTELNIPHELIVTEKAGQCSEIARDLDISAYYGVVLIGGDGLYYEYNQGIMSREDSQNALQLPVGVLPGGSGNAMCCSINYAAGQQFKSDMLMHSLYILLKHSILPLDLIQLDSTAGRLYSVLSVTWGMTADVDIESERFRKLGNARFTVEAIAKIIKPRTYRGRIQFKPIYNYVNKGRSKTDADIIDEQPVSSAEAWRQRSISMPFSGVNNDTVPTDSTNGVMSNGNTRQQGAGDSITPDTTSPIVELPPLDIEVPSDWITIEDNFISIIATYQTHLGPELMIAPSATMTDGLIYLLMIRAPLTRMQSINLFTEFEDGSHVKNPLVELIPVTAFRLTPFLSEGNLVVDGEKVPYGPIQGRVLPRAARLMAM